MEGSQVKPWQVIFKTGEDEHSISGFAFPTDFKGKERLLAVFKVVAFTPIPSLYVVRVNNGIREKYQV